MYLCKREIIKKVGQPLLGCLCVFATATSCTEKTERLYSPTAYYPIHIFFQNEVDSLKTLNPAVTKTVGKGSEKETKNDIQIKNWENELGAFLAINLSKPAYRNQYSMDSTANSITYHALENEVDINRVHLVFDSQKQIDSVEITRSTHNLLYKNIEKLTYKRGVSYTLSKDQDILLLGKNHYNIVGRFQK